MVVYHGTKGRFTAFDPSKQKNGWLGKGFYFTDDKPSAKSFGRSVFSVFLNVKSPFVVKGEDTSSFVSEVKKAYLSESDDMPINLTPVLERNGHDGAFVSHWDFQKEFIPHSTHHK